MKKRRRMPVAYGISFSCELLSHLQPHLVGPHSPDKAHPVSRMQADVDSEGYPQTVSAALVGSCTNSSYEDITRVASLARFAKANGLKAAEGVEFLITPGSEGEAQLKTMMASNSLPDVWMTHGWSLNLIW